MKTRLDRTAQLVSTCLHICNRRQEHPFLGRTKPTPREGSQNPKTISDVLVQSA